MTSSGCTTNLNKPLSIVCTVQAQSSNSRSSLLFRKNMAQSSNEESHRKSSTSTASNLGRDKDASESESTENSTSSSSPTKMIKISAWLFPPAVIFPILQEDIDQLASTNQTTSFPPHVTLVGDVKVDQADIPTILMNFKELFQGFGRIPCKFNRERGVVDGYDDSDDNDDKEQIEDVDDDCKECQVGDGRRRCKWNQTAVAILHRDDQLMRCIKLSRRILFMTNDICIANPTSTSSANACKPPVVENDDELFSPPTNEPHFSLAYSELALSHSVQDFPPDFDSTEVVIFYTDPSTLAGVANWKELGRISTV